MSGRVWLLTAQSMQLLDLGMHYLLHLQCLAEETAKLKNVQGARPKTQPWNLLMDGQQNYSLLDFTHYELQECMQILCCN